MLTKDILTIFFLQNLCVTFEYANELKINYLAKNWTVGSDI